MDNVADISIWVALWAGLISFISPCTLPLYPAYLSYITGISVQNIQEGKSHQVRWKLLSHSVFFLLGVSIIYVALGLSASFIGQFFNEHRMLIQQIGGILIVVMGLFLLGVFRMDWLMKERRFQFTTKPAGYVGSTLIGIGFAAGWMPCIGPILTLIITLAAANPSYGMTYMGAYIVGFALPFLGLSFFIGSTRWIMKYSDLIMKIGAVIMIVMGVLLYTDMLFYISAYINQLIEGTWLQRIG